jgi:hypothetical protein
MWSVVILNDTPGRATMAAIHLSHAHILFSEAGVPSTPGLRNASLKNTVGSWHRVKEYIYRLVGGLTTARISPHEITQSGFRS